MFIWLKIGDHYGNSLGEHFLSTQSVSSKHVSGFLFIFLGVSFFYGCMWSSLSRMWGISLLFLVFVYQWSWWYGLIMFMMFLRVDRTSFELKGVVVVLELWGWSLKVREVSCYLYGWIWQVFIFLHACVWLWFGIKSSTSQKCICCHVI